MKEFRKSVKTWQSCRFGGRHGVCGKMTRNMAAWRLWPTCVRLLWFSSHCIEPIRTDDEPVCLRIFLRLRINKRVYIVITVSYRSCYDHVAITTALYRPTQPTELYGTIDAKLVRQSEQLVCTIPPTLNFPSCDRLHCNFRTPFDLSQFTARHRVITSHNARCYTQTGTSKLIL